MEKKKIDRNTLKYYFIDNVHIMSIILSLFKNFSVFFKFTPNDMYFVMKIVQFEENILANWVVEIRVKTICCISKK